MKRQWCFLVHDWSKWEQYVESGTVVMGRLMPKSVQGKTTAYAEKRQRRTCRRCGKMQDEEL